MIAAHQSGALEELPGRALDIPTVRVDQQPVNKTKHMEVRLHLTAVVHDDL